MKFFFCVGANLNGSVGKGETKNILFLAQSHVNHTFKSKSIAWNIIEILFNIIWQDHNEHWPIWQ